MRVSKSLVVRAGAVVATAAVALSGAAAAADAATTGHHVKVATALSISNTTPVLHRHHLTTAIIRGQLTAPTTTGTATISGKRVFLERRGVKGHWYVVQIGRTGRGGWVRFRVGVRRVAVHFRLVFRGTWNFARSTSAVDTITPK
jgi:hypothetical protein